MWFFNGFANILILQKIDFWIFFNSTNKPFLKHYTGFLFPEFLKKKIQSSLYCRLKKFLLFYRQKDVLQLKLQRNIFMKTLKMV